MKISPLTWNNSAVMTSEPALLWFFHFWIRAFTSGGETKSLYFGHMVFQFDCCFGVSVWLSCLIPISPYFNILRSNCRFVCQKSFAFLLSLWRNGVRLAHVSLPLFILKARFFCATNCHPHCHFNISFAFRTEGSFLQPFWAYIPLLLHSALLSGGRIRVTLPRW